MSAPSPKRVPKTPRPDATEMQDSPAQPGTSIAPAENVQLDREKIAVLAYSYWEGRGYQGGSPEEDWLLAEEQLRAGS